jgi:hypothetical protein
MIGQLILLFATVCIVSKFLWWLTGLMIEWIDEHIDRNNEGT